MALSIQRATQRSALGRAELATEGMTRLKTSRLRVRLRQSGRDSKASRDGVGATRAAGHQAAPEHKGRLQESERAEYSASPAAENPATANAEPTLLSNPEAAPLATRLLDSKRKRQQ